MAGDTAVSKRSYCKICTNQCGVVIDVDGDQIGRIKGDFDHPLSKGYTCPKGRAIGKLHHHPEAITQPLMRTGDALVPVGWDECLDDIAARLKAVVDRYGPNSVGVYFGSGLGMDASGYRMAEALYRGFGAPPKFSPITIDGANKLLVSCLVGGFPGLSSGKTDNDNVDMLLYVGVNPMVSHGHNTGMFNPAGPIRAIAARGEVWTIDPLRTETAKFSTRHIAPYPGKDYAILAWLVREIIKDGPMTPAQPFVGLEEIRTALAGFDRATAATIAGVTERELDDLLAAIRGHGGVTVEMGTGVSMSKSANLTQWFGWVLMILTGRMNRTGGVWFHPGFILQYDSFPLPVIDPFTPGPPTMPGVSGIIGDWPCAALPSEIESGNIRALINLGGSIVRSFPDANVLIPALEKLEVNVDFEIIANDTTALSTHVLPTKDQVERPEISMWDTLCASVSMLYSPALVEPMGERRSAWWAISQLMRRMGMEVPDTVPLDDREPGADDAMLAAIMQGARVPFEEVQAAGSVTVPLEFPARWVDDHVERMGGWRLAPPTLLAFWDEIRTLDEVEMHDPPPLRYISRRQRRKLNASLSFLGSPADIILNPEDAVANGIEHGQMVRIHTSRGEIFMTANVDPAIRRGVASIPHGHEVANVNRLTSVENVDGLTGMVLYTGIPIGVEPVPG